MPQFEYLPNGNLVNLDLLDDDTRAIVMGLQQQQAQGAPQTLQVPGSAAPALNPGMFPFGADPSGMPMQPGQTPATAPTTFEINPQAAIPPSVPRPQAGAGGIDEGFVPAGGFGMGGEQPDMGMGQPGADQLGQLTGWGLQDGGGDLDLAMGRVGEQYNEAVDNIARINEAQIQAQTDAMIRARDEAQGLEDAWADTQKAIQGEQAKYQSMILDLDNQIQNSKIDSGRIFKDAGAGKMVLGALGMMLGALGAAFTGGPNVAAGIIDKAIDRDIDAQRADIQKLQLRQTGAKNMLAMYNDKLGNERAATAALKAQIYQRLQVESEQIQAKTQSQLVKQNAEAAKAQFAQKALLEQQKFQNEMAKVVMSKALSARSGQKEPTDTQRQRALYVADLLEAEKNFQHIGNQGFNRASVGNLKDIVAGKFGAGLLQDPLFRAQMQAELMFADAVLRPRTGATVPVEEKIDYADTYFPRLGDGPELVAQKARARQTAIRSMMGAAGPQAMIEAGIDPSNPLGANPGGVRKRQVPSWEGN